MKFEREIEISVKDTGIGIPEERIEKIFDRFYQVDGSNTREGEGTGIGLALTKELVELHKGIISVESKEGVGTEVTILLPLSKEEPVHEEAGDSKSTEDLLEVSAEAGVGSSEEIVIDSEKAIVLIIEDNRDLPPGAPSPTFLLRACRGMAVGLNA